MLYEQSYETIERNLNLIKNIRSGLLSEASDLARTLKAGDNLPIFIVNGDFTQTQSLPEMLELQQKALAKMDDSIYQGPMVFDRIPLAIFQAICCTHSLEATLVIEDPAPFVQISDLSPVWVALPDGKTH